MTPKEKAVDLWVTYRFALSIKNAPLGKQKDLIAKQCALITANEIVDNLELCSDTQCIVSFGEGESFDVLKYFQEVKKELTQEVKEELEKS